MTTYEPADLDAEPAPAQPEAREAGERYREIADREAAAAEQPDEPEQPGEPEPEQPGEPAPTEAEAIAKLQAAGEFPPQDPLTRKCATCDGHGKTYTGSGVDGDVLRKCGACDGHGYQVRRLTPEQEERQRDDHWLPPDAIPWGA